HRDTEGRHVIGTVPPALDSVLGELRQSGPGGGRATHGPLLLRPPESTQAERRPMVLRLLARIHLVLQPKQAEVPRHVRPEPRDLNVVPQEIWRLRNSVRPAREEPLLVIEARPP